MNAPLARLVALLLAASLGVAACSSSDDDTEAASATTSDNGGGSLLDVTAPAADGSTIDLSDYAGQDLMLWFWAPW